MFFVSDQPPATPATDEREWRLRASYQGSSPTHIHKVCSSVMVGVSDPGMRPNEQIVVVPKSRLLQATETLREAERRIEELGRR